MRFIHLSDLHIGKRFNEYSMIEDQKYILAQILDVIDNARAEAVIIAGDVYDKSVPSAEAVELFDNFLCKLASRNLPTFVISGNHDSPERIAFGARLMTASKIYMSPVYNGVTAPVTLRDEFGEIDVYMLPFIKPANVRRFYPDAEINSYTDAIKVAIDGMGIETAKRNILITHQFVTGADRTESEEVSVGGTDNVDVSVFTPFDYVALGHIHRAQRCTRDTVRYCGTPLKYSFSEANDKKTVTVVNLGAKGDIELEYIGLKPLHDLKEIKGSYNDIMQKSFYEGTSYQSDYMHITLTDEEDIPDAIGKLRTVYKNLMRLDYDNRRTRNNAVIETDLNARNKSPLTLFSEFYKLQNNSEMSEEQSEYVSALIEEIWEDNQ
ncbi:MAG: exonuclease SbcCD subunit D [Candidatus Coproplasma sp.]